MKRTIYSPPEVEALEITVEAGFAETAGGTTEGIAPGSGVDW